MDALEDDYGNRNEKYRRNTKYEGRRHKKRDKPHDRDISYDLHHILPKTARAIITKDQEER